MTIETTRRYLITPSGLAKSFILEADREHFSHPVPVEMICSDVSTRQVVVRDLVRDTTYPTNPRWLRTWLTPGRGAA